MSNKITLHGETRRYVLITITLLIFLLALVYTFYSSHLMVNKYTPLIDATMEIKLEATTAHLWLEEKLSGDRYEDFDKIVKHIQEARWYATAMLEGGENPEGTFIPLEDIKLRKEIEKAIQGLDAFKKITLERYKSIATSGIGTDIDQQYDRLFTTFITQVDHVETLLQQKIKEDYARYQSVQILLICTLFVFGFIALYAQYRYDHAKKEAIWEIQKARLQAEESENWLKTTMNSMGDGVIITDHQGLVTYLNPVASSLTGWRVNDAKFKKMTEVFNIVNEYTKEPVEDPVEMVIRKNVVVGLANHTELIAKDGTVWPIADSAAPIFDKDNNLLGVVVVFHEITAQKKAESEKALLESQLGWAMARPVAPHTR